jgi:hypothetical protein
MADINPQQQEMMERWYDALQNATRSMGPLADEQQKLAEATKKTKDRLKDLGDGLATAGTATKSFAKAMLDSGEGTEKYAKATTEAANAVDSFASQFGFFGKALGGLVKIFGGVISAGLEHNAALIKGYQTLSDFGAIDTRGVDGLFKDLAAAGLTAMEFDKFGNVLKKIRPDLAAMGGDVAKGKGMFVKTMSEILGGQLERDLRAIGYTTESISENAALALAREGRIGALQGKTQREITFQTGLYLKELAELTALTGMSREEAQQKRDAMLSDARFNDKMEELRQTDAKAYEHAMKGFLVLEKELGEEATRGIKDIFRTGTLSTEAAAKIYMTSGAGVMDLVKSLKNSGETLTGENGAFSKFGKRFDQVYKGTFETAAQYSDDTARELYGNTQAIFGSRRLQLYDTKKVEELILEQKLKGEKDRLNLDMKNAQNERKLRLTMNELLYKASDGLVQVFSKLIEVATGFGKTMARFVDVLTDKFGSVLGIGKTNLSAYFIDDLASATEELKIQEQKLPDILKDRAKIEKELTETQEKRKKAEEEVAKSTTAVGKALAKTQHGDPEGYSDRIKNLEKQLSENKSRESEINKTIKSLKEVQENKKSDNADANKAAAQVSAKTAERAGTQSDAESRRLGMTQLDSNKTPEDKKPENVAGAQKILDFVAKYESGGDYNKMYGGKSNSNLSNMSIAEVLDFQKKNGPALGSSAIGKYQFMQDTIKGLIAKGVISPTDKFDAATQEKMGMALLEGRGYSKYKSGKLSAEEFANNIAAEWAGMPMPNGQSRYAGDGKNKALVGRPEFLAQLEQASKGGIFTGPGSGFPVLLHPNEIVVPLKDPGAVLAARDVMKKELPEVSSSSNSVDSGMVDMVSMLASKMDEMIAKLNDSYRTQEELLQYTRA